MEWGLSMLIPKWDDMHYLYSRHMSLYTWSPCKGRGTIVTNPTNAGLIYILNLVIITVPADVLSLNGARQSAGQVMTPKLLVFSFNFIIFHTVFYSHDDHANGRQEIARPHNTWNANKHQIWNGFFLWVVHANNLNIWHEQVYTALCHQPAQLPAILHQISSGPFY